MNKYIHLYTFLAVLALAGVNFAQPVVYAEHEVYNPGDTVSAVFGNGPGNPSDWLGIYKAGDIPGQQNPFDYLYVNNTHTPGVAFTEGRVSFTGVSLTEGTYWVGFLFNNSDDSLIASDTFTVSAGQPFISLNNYEYSPGDTIKVRFKNGPGNAADWIGIYADGDTAESTPSTYWFYTNGTMTASGNLTEGIVTFNSGITNTGKWWMGFFENDGYTLLDSVGFVVKSATAVDDNPAAVKQFDLKQNYPNPFNPSTNIVYTMAEAGQVSLKIFDMLGKEVAELINEYKPAGTYNAEFSAGKFNLASGVYLYKLKAGNFISTKKMTLLK